MAASSTDRIRKQVELKAPVSRVWRALTDSKEFGQWFRVNLQGPFVAGKLVRGNVTYPGFEHMAFEVSVTAIEPEHRFAFQWHPHPEDPKRDYSSEPMTTVEFQLEKTAAGTRLTVTESGFDALPDARRALAFRMNEQGWEGQLQNIEAHVR